MLRYGLLRIIMSQGIADRAHSLNAVKSLLRGELFAGLVSHSHVVGAVHFAPTIVLIIIVHYLLTKVDLLQAITTV